MSTENDYVLRWRYRIDDQNQKMINWPGLQPATGCRSWATPASFSGFTKGAASDLPAIDIEIEKNKVREWCLEVYPDREELYEMIYESRFQRLQEQFPREDAEM